MRFGAEGSSRHPQTQKATARRPFDKSSQDATFFSVEDGRTPVYHDGRENKEARKIEGKITYQFLRMKAEQAFMAGRMAEALRWSRLVDEITAKVTQGEETGDEKVM